MPTTRKHDTKLLAKARRGELTRGNTRPGNPGGARSTALRTCDASSTPSSTATRAVRPVDYAFRANHLREVPAAVRFLSVEPMIGPVELDLEGLHWVIVGGESGPRARSIQADWVRAVRDQCIIANVAFFFKQWGGRTSKAGGRELDGRAWDEMPLRMALVP
jgi:protein gp37